MEQTFEKYIKIARTMRETKDYTLDIRKYDNVELMIIQALATRDSIFDLFSGYEKMTLRDFCAAMHIFEAMQLAKNKMCNK